MANEPQDTSTTAPTATDIAKAIADSFVSIQNIERVWAGGENAGTKLLKIGIGTILGMLGRLAAEAAAVIVDGEDIAAPAFQRMMHVAFKDITGIDMGGSAIGLGGRGGRAGAAQSLGAALFSAIAGGSGGAAGAGGIEPSTKGAEDYVTWVTQMALEGWITGTIGEMVTLGQVESLGDLDDALAGALGLGRMSRRVMAPLLDAKVITPFRWHVNKAYRPELLSAAETIRQVNRGRWTREQGLEELARQGYSDARIEALLNASRRFSSPGEARTFVYYNYWTNDQAIQHLRDQGYDEQAAIDALRLEGLRRNAQFEDAAASVLISAYAARDIDDPTFTGLLGDVVTNAKERTFAQELGRLRRAVNVRRITSAQTAAAVRAGILNVIDYRRALEREGYPDEDVIALELLLRAELDKEAAIAEHRARVLAERAEEKRRRELERQRRAAELEEQRAADRRGPTAALEQAAIRGLVPIDRVAELYSQDYDPDAVAVLVSLLEDKRTAYVDAQQRRSAAEQRAARQGLTVGEQRAAVRAGILTLDEFRRYLEGSGMVPDDVRVLVETLAAEITARDAALEARRQAAAAADRRRIDLGRFEQLVRRGARSLEQYAALLADLGFDDGSVAAMRELLELKIRDDARAREVRELADAARREKGPTVTQYQRGVLLGVKTRDDYEQFLIAQRFSVDAQILLLAELDNELAEAEAARQRRQRESATVESPALPLATVRRAAQLGVISPATYVARLEREGYSADDVDLELDLLLLEIGDVQQQRADRELAEDGAGAKGLTLAQTERAVKAGIASIEDYRSAAAGAGLSPEASDTLVQLLERELAQVADARARRDTIDGELATRSLSVAQLEEAVTKGLKTADDFYAEILGLGYGAEDAEVLTALLTIDLERARAGA